MIAQTVQLAKIRLTRRHRNPNSHKGSPRGNFPTPPEDGVHNDVRAPSAAGKAVTRSNDAPRTMHHRVTSQASIVSRDLVEVSWPRAVKDHLVRDRSRIK